MEGSGSLVDFDWSLRVRPGTPLPPPPLPRANTFGHHPPPPAHHHHFHPAAGIFQLVLSSSHLSSMRKPVLMVDLNLKYADGSTKNSVLEFNEGDLDSVLDSLSSVEKVGAGRGPGL